MPRVAEQSGKVSVAKNFKVTVSRRLTAIANGLLQIGTWCHGSAVFGGVVYMTKEALLTGCSVAFDCICLTKTNYACTGMLPETINAYHIHCGDQNVMDL